MQINNKTFIVTGAAQGIGLAITRSLIKKNANVILADLNNIALKNAIKDLNSAQVLAIKTDVANENDVQELFHKAQDKFGALDGIINNAGILKDGLLIKARENQVVDFMSLEQWQSVIDVNLTGVFLCAREAAKRMISNKSPGVIINISSISRAGNAGQSNYAAAKAGVAALTVTWAQELARFNIRVGAIAPGAFATEMLQSMKKEKYDAFVARIPLKRTGTLDEIAAAVNFIIQNEYFTGRTLELDGGLRL